MPNDGNKITKLLQDELGVTLNYELTTSDMQETRIGTMLAGGDYPDIIAQAEQRGDMISQGSMIRLDDYLASGKFPRLQAHVAPFINKLSWSGGGVPNGLYIFPNYNRFYNQYTETTPWGAPGFWLQKDVLEFKGYPDTVNLTPETYFQWIEEYVAANPTIDGVPTIGFLIPMYTGQDWAFFNQVAMVQGSPNNGGVIVMDKFDGSVPNARIYVNDDYAYRYLKLLNEVNTKGLIDRESFTMTQDDFFAKVASGAVVGFSHQRWAFGNGQDPLVAAGRYERTYVPTTPTYDGIDPWYFNVPVMNIQQGMGISVDAEDPEMILAFLEIMMDEYWQKVLFWGIEGEDYLVNSEGLFYRTEEMRSAQEQIDWQADNRLMAFRDQLPKHEGTWADGNPDSAGRSMIEFYETLSDYDKNLMDQYGYKTWSEFLNDAPANPPYFPAWQIQLGDAGREADGQLNDLRAEYYPRLVICDPADFDSIWDEFNSKVDRVDVPAYIADIDAGLAAYYN
jgi:putative aldouronate transport system substrate-binding protein